MILVKTLPLVSIYCLVYNHEKYLRQTLENFVKQKTSFKFEVIVHDDASSDGSVDIIREFEKAYPDIIKPIYQTENQYSKGVNIFNYIKPKIKGKYVAICEGDDYWLDDNKLQKQVDFLEKNSQYIACVHNSFQENLVNGKKFIMYGDVEKDLTLDDVIVNGGAQYHTSSLLYRSNYMINKPDFLDKAGIGDYPLSIYLAMNGKIKYFPDVMSVYRYGTVGSWSKRNSTLDKRILHAERMINLLENINSYSSGIYIEIINSGILNFKFNLFAWKGEYKEIFKSEYKQCWKNLTRLGKILYLIGVFFPRLFEIKWRLWG